MSPAHPVTGTWISHKDYIHIMKTQKETAQEESDMPSTVVLEDNVIHSDSKPALEKIEGYIAKKFFPERFEPTLSYGMWLKYMIVVADLEPDQRASLVEWLGDHYNVEEA